MSEARHPSPSSAALFMMAAAALVAATTVFAKALGVGHLGEIPLGAPLHPLQISHGRFLFALMAVCTVALFLRPRFQKPSAPLHLARSLFGWAGVTMMFAAAAYIPLADASAISFLNPVFAMMFAIPFLGERVGRVRWSAALIALVGAAILTRPGSDAIELGALLALAAAVLFGAETILIKLLTGREAPIQILLINNSIGVVIATLAACFVWQWPSPAQWVCLAAIGVVMAAAQACFVQAMSRAEASFVAPFFFTTLVFAAIYDAVVFGVLPNAVSVIGAAIILLGAGLLTWREAMLRRRSTDGTAPGSAEG